MCISWDLWNRTDNLLLNNVDQEELVTQVHFKHLNVDVRSILDGRLVGRVGLLLKWPKGQCAGDPCAAVIDLELG